MIGRPLDTEVRGSTGVWRRAFVRTAGAATALAAAGFGLEGILAARHASAYPPRS